jgi:putative ABC transport system permease protein
MIHLLVRDLLRRPWRTGLTVLGVAVAACSYILLVGSAESFERRLGGVAPTLGIDLVIEEAGAPSPFASSLPDDTARRVARVPGVAGASSVVFGRTTIPGSAWFLVVGLDASEPLASRLPVVRGRPLAGAGEMLFGESAATTRGLEPGAAVTVRGTTLRLVGVVRTAQSLLDAAAVMELHDAQRAFNLPGVVNLLVVDPAAGTDSLRLADEIRRRVPGVAVKSLAELVGTTSLLRVGRQFARLLGLLAVGIAALGAANVLSITILERTSEIAVLRAVGWKRRRIAMLLLLENLAFGVVGGIVAVPLAAVVLKLLVRFGPGAAIGMLASSPSPRAAIEGLALSTLAAALGAVVPMIRALSIAPAAALRTA